VVEHYKSLNASACRNPKPNGKRLGVSFFKRFAKSKALVCIEPYERGMNIVVRNVSGSALSDASVLVLDDEGESLQEQFIAWVEKHNLTKQLCNVVLPPPDYQLLMIEKPDVPAEEMRDAVKWKLKDLVTSPIESLAVDTIEIPQLGNQQSKEMIYAVVTDLEKVKAIISLVQSAGLTLRAIDIDVLALRNIIREQDTSRGVAILRVATGKGELAVYRDGDLYLSRRFKLNYNGGLLDDLPAEDLGLELQRSFDYLERQMRQVPPALLYVCGRGIGSEKIDDNVRQHLNIPVEFLELSQFVTLSGDNIDEGISQLCVAAMGVALREEAA